MKQFKLTAKLIPAIIAMVLSTTGFAQLNGNYTIGGASPDYPTLVSAVNALNSNGVSGPVTFDIRSGTYTGQVSINSISGASATNRITFQSETGNPSDVTINFNPGSSNNYIIRLNNASYITIKKITVTTLSTSRGRLIEFRTNASYNVVDNCILDAVGTSSNMACIYGTSLRGTDNTFKNNMLTHGYYGIYFRGSGTSYSNNTKNTVIENNEYDNVWYYSNYLYYQHNLKFRGNAITKTDNGTHYGARIYYSDNKLEFTDNTITMDGTGTRYGLYAYYNDGGMIVSNNKITITNTGTKYGMRMYYNYGIPSNVSEVMNNVIAIDNGTSTAYGLFNYYSEYQLTANNSINVKSTSSSTVAARFYFTSTAYSHNDVLNNAFSNETGSGYTLYLYNGNQAYNNTWDYNNIYNGTNKLIQTVSPSQTYTTLASWQAAYDQDMNSISYDPGFTSTTDLRPNVNNPACWSLNGRAVHIQGNNLDYAKNNRIVNLADGVPDIGAYEFIPESLPPLATATPSTADPGDVQVFTFGQREVCQVKWGLSGRVPQLEVRQYSGEMGVGIAAAAAPFGTMYFHTDIDAVGNGNNFDFELNLDYMDIWLGTIGNENDLRLANKVPSYSWMVYSGMLSSSNALTNNIDAPKLVNFASFTGLENGSIPSAFVIPQGKTTICIGNSVVLDAEPKSGDYYKWFLNGKEIQGASGANATTYTATQPGNYSVEITYSGKVVESIPLGISTIAPPNAVVKANGPLTYCTGNGLVLNAGNTPGVTYQWKLNGVDIPGATNSSYMVTQPGDYRVLVENIGCASTSTATAIQAGPLNVYLGNDTSYCEVKNVYAKLDAGYPGAKYLWSTGETTQTIQVKKAGKYTVHVDAGPNCVDDDEIIVNIDPLPAAAGISFVQNGNTYQFFPGGPVGATGFLWIFSDGTMTTANNPVKTITGDLYVRMVMFNACGSDTMQLGWPLTVSNVAEASDLSIYPNPASNNVNISLNGAELNAVEVINSTGSVVYRAALKENKHSIDVSGMANGHYMIRAVTSSGTVTKQFNILR